MEKTKLRMVPNLVSSINAAAPDLAMADIWANINRALFDMHNKVCVLTKEAELTVTFNRMLNSSLFDAD